MNLVLSICHHTSFPHDLTDVPYLLLIHTVLGTIQKYFIALHFDHYLVTYRV